jgi:hypothetical protein
MMMWAMPLYQEMTIGSMDLGNWTFSIEEAVKIQA